MRNPTSFGIEVIAKMERRRTEIPKQQCRNKNLGQDLQGFRTRARMHIAHRNTGKEKFVLMLKVHLLCFCSGEFPVPPVLR